MATKPNASALSRVTAVIVGVLDVYSILILAVLNRMNRDLKIILYHEDKFSKDAQSLTRRDNVLFLNHPNLNYPEILTLICETMASEDSTIRATIVGVIERINCDEWKRAIDTAGKMPGKRIKLLFEIPSLSEKEMWRTSLIGIFSDFFVGWDRHCIALLPEDSNLARSIPKALSIENVYDTKRRLYLAKHFARSLEPDEIIQGWLSEFQLVLTACKEAYGASKDLGEGIWRFVQPNTRSEFVLLSLHVDKEALLVIQDCPYDSNGHRVYFKAEHELSAKAIGVAKERHIKYEATGSSVWVAPEHEQAMTAIYRELLTKEP